MPVSEMAALLRAGSAAWNEWRIQYPNELVNVSNANLSRVDLSGADLHGVLLRGANLREAGMTGSNLSSANLSNADLSGAAIDSANLAKADLRGSYLIYASGQKADLRQANLNGANLTGADLQGVDLEASILVETVLVDTNLFGAKGLDLCEVPGPNMLDHRTVARSQGLPITFLRRCGLPDDVIEAYGALNRRLPSCFISYSSKDEQFVRALYSSLQNEGIRCWFAPEDLPIGERIRPAIDREIHDRDRVVLVLSANSIKSRWVEKEAETAFEKAYAQKGSVLVPIRLDDTVLETDQSWAADIRRTINIGDFRDWQNPVSYQNAFHRLMRDLRSNVGG